ncbi:MAG: ABC transporter ATP-binding protein [Gemmatimonadales bacterium]|nr:ABC transporter ATP-binding protein [Gemmatimonadales bacterium]
MTPIVRLEDAVFTYPGRRVPALKGLTLEIRRGEVTCVTGPMGAGTSTLLLVAAGFAPRLTGGTLAGTREILAARPGIVFATPWTQLTGICHTVADEVAFGPASHGLPAERVRADARRAMEQLGVAHLAARDPATLSGGELQRVVVASALALGPDLLVLDDPAAELDPEGADALYALFRTLAAAGVAVLFATPDLDRAARTASRAIVLEDGHVVADGPPAATLDGTDVAEIARVAGCPSPLPLDVDGLMARLAR